MIVQEFKSRREVHLGLGQGDRNRSFVVIGDSLLTRILVVEGDLKVVLLTEAIESSPVLDLKGDPAASAEPIGQEGCASLADELALRHYADTVSENLRLIHIVRCQDDHAVLLVRVQHVPHTPSSGDIQASRRLIE